MFLDCTEESFSCSNGIQCVPPNAVCDPYGNLECEDGSDQENCKLIAIYDSIYVIICVCVQNH